VNKKKEKKKVTGSTRVGSLNLKLLLTFTFQITSGQKKKILFIPQILKCPKTVPNISEKILT